MRAQVVLGHLPAGVQRLAVDEGDFFARGAEPGEPHPPVDVLAEVDHLVSAGKAGDGRGCGLFHWPDNTPDERVKLTEVEFKGARVRIL